MASSPANGAMSATVVAGVLNKYTNIAKGWRDRLFVLSGDQLHYYKLSGRNGVNVQRILEQFDPGNNNTKLIGAQIFMLQKSHQRASMDKAQGRHRGAASGEQAPAGTYDLKHVRLRESGTESHKFYIRAPNERPVTLKTETPDDRVAWLSALTVKKVEQSARGSQYPAVDTDIIRADSFGLDAVPAAQRQHSADGGTFSATLAELRGQGLSAEGAARIEAEVAALREQLESARAELRKRDGEMRTLLDERRQLQTEMVAENSQRNGRIESAMPESDGQESSSTQHVDDDMDSANGSDASDGERFYDASSLGGSARVSAALSSERGSSGAVLPTAAPAAAPAAAPVPLSAAPPAAVSVAAASEPAKAAAAPGAALEPDWLANAAPIERRAKLPEPAETQKSVSLWSIIKECIGKDLTRICLPVFFNEPLSALQKITEEFEHASLLERAARAPRGSVDRLILVAVFAISGYAGSVGRTCKPFNPLLGETFEHVDARRRFRVITEKVVHHPTILAGVCEGAGWTVAADLEVRSKFWGRCIELKPIGRIECTFHDGEVVTWNKVTTTINNLILGKIYVEHCGTMRVQSADLPTEVRVKFKDGGVFSGSKRAVTGRLHEGGRDLHSHKLEGVWDESITLDTGSGPQELWHAAPPAKHPTRYNLSQFAIELNEMTAGLQPHLPPTDCRLRPDQAALERGKFDLANAEKQRLEQKQRRARKEAEEGKPIHSRWFRPVPGAKRGEQLSFVYTGDYWQERAAGRWTGCRDIFGPEEPSKAEA